jgi:germination protein M
VSPRRADLLTALALLALLALVSTTAPRWARLLQQSAPTTDDEARTQPATPEPTPEASASGEARRTLNVKLFFESQDGSGLTMEERAIEFHTDLPRQVRGLVEELIRGPKGEAVACLSPETRVLAVFVAAQGVAFVDLSSEVRQSLAGGSRAERLAVYSLVNSVVTSFPVVRRVQILIDDRPAETLNGHIDLSRPLLADMTVLADSLISPATPQPSAPAPQASPLLPQPTP